MVSILAFCNRIRTLLDLEELPWIWLAGAEPDSERGCVVATALGAAVGGAESPEWRDQPDSWVMRFDDAPTARRVGIVMGLEWRAGSPEVALPDALIDLAVSHHFRLVRADDIGRLVAWAVIDGETQEVVLHTPDELLVAADLGGIRLAA